MDIITRFLKGVNQRKQFFQATHILLVTLVISLGLWSGLSLLNQKFHFQELTAFNMLFISASILSIGALTALLSLVARSKNYAAVSQLIEKENRLFKDSLNGSAFILDQNKNTADLSELEKLMVNATKNKIRENKLDLSFLKPTHFNKMLFLGIPVILACLAISLSFSNLSFKAFWYAQDLSSNTNTYFTITPGDATIRTGSTLQIKVKLNREQLTGSPLYIYTDQDGAFEKFSLTHKGDNNYIFNIYSIEKDCQYYINNYTNTSSKYSIAVYELPKFKTKKIIVSPPAYTRIKSTTHEEPEYLTVPENSSIHIQFETNKPVEAFIKFEGSTKKFKKTSQGAYYYQWRIKKYTEYAILLKDKEGHEFKTDPDWIIETIPDLPPIADITAPKDDQEYLGVEEVDFSAVLYDDYQIKHANLVFEIPGQGLHRIPFRLKENKKNGITINKNIYVNLLDFNLQNGDIVSYYIEAVDNKKLVPQVSISDVKFLNIIPGAVEKDKKKKEKQKGQDKKDFRLDDLYAEAKKIYRKALPLKFEPDLEIKKDEILDIGNQLGDLRINISKRYQQLQKISKKNDLGIVSRLFEDLIEKTDAAEKNMRDFDITKSLGNQMVGLQDIHKLIKLLSKPKSKGDKSKNPSKPDKEKEKKEAKKKQDLKKTIKDLAEKLEEAKQANDSLNKKMARSKGPLGKHEKDFFSKEKQQVQEEITAIKDEMQSFKELFKTADMLQSANQELKKEINQIKKGQKQASLQHSKKSEFLVNKALEGLNEMLKKMTQGEFSKLESQMNKMLSKQQELKKKSGKANDPKAQKELAKQQAQIADDLKAFKKAAQKTLESIEDKAPKAFDELSKALENLNKEKLERKAGKASKSIFYGMNKKAQKEQSKILKALNKAKKGLKQAKGQMPDVSKDALVKALKDLGKLQQKGQKQSDKQSAQELKKTVKEMNQKKTPQFLKDVVKLADQLKDSKPGQAGITAAELVQETISLVEKELRKMERNKILKKKIKQQHAPAKYKSMVEKYFKNLSRQPAK